MTQYYLDGSNGSDSNSGLVGNPVRTWSKLNSLLGPGDEAIVESGTYTGTVDITASGTLANPIVIRSRTTNGAKLVGDWTDYNFRPSDPTSSMLPSGATAGTPGFVGTIQFHVQGDYVTVRGFEMYGVGGIGFKSSSAQGVRFEQCYAHHVYDSGFILEDNDGSEIFECTAYECSMRGRFVDAGIVTEHPAVVAMTFSKNSGITTSVIYESGGEGVDLGRGGGGELPASAIRADNYATGNVIGNNRTPQVRIDWAGQGGEVSGNILYWDSFLTENGSQSSAIRIRDDSTIESGGEVNTHNRSREIDIFNNLVIGSGYGIEIDPGANLEDYYIAHNTIVNCDYGVYGSTKSGSLTRTWSGTVVENNVLHNCVRNQLSDNTGQTWRYNHWDSLALAPTNARGTGDVYGDPSLVNVSAAWSDAYDIDIDNYKLESGSTARNAGRNTGTVTEDFSGRALDSTPDMGAFQYFEEFDPNAKYVSPNGDDNNAGTSAKPYRTIQKGIDSAPTGGTIYVLPGTYDGFTANKSGQTIVSTSQFAAICDGGWSNTNTFPHTPGTWPSRYTPLVHITASNVTIDGFTIRNSTGRGLQTTGDGWDARNCKVYNTFNTGVQSFYCDNGTFHNIEVYSASLQRKWKYDTINGVYVNNHPNVFALIGTSGSTIEYCHVHDSGGEGIDLFRCGGNNTIQYCYAGNNAAMNYYVNWAGPNNVVRYNVAYQTIPTSQLVGGSTDSGGLEFRDEYQSAGKGFTRSSGTKVYGNLVVGCSTLLWITKYAGMENARIFNNTFVAGPYTTDGCKVEARDSSASFTGAQVKNNIFLLGSSATKYPESQIDFDFNLWSKLPSANLRGNNDLVEDPVLVNPITNFTGAPDPTNYIKDVGSPGIDGGTSSLMTEDMFGTVMSSPDMGFEEYTEGSTPPTTPPTEPPTDPGNTEMVLLTGTPTGSYNTGSTGETISHTTDANTNLLVVAVMGMKSQVGSVTWTATGVTFNGNALTLAQRAQGYSTNRNYTVEIWYLNNPGTSTTANVVTTLDATVNDVYTYVMNVKNTDATTPVGDTASDVRPTGGAFTASATITADGMWMFCGIERADSGSGWTPGTGVTEQLDYASGTGSSDITTTVAYKNAVSTGSLTTDTTAPAASSNSVGCWVELLPGVTGVIVSDAVASAGVSSGGVGTIVKGSVMVSDAVAQAGVAIGVPTTILTGAIYITGAEAEAGVAQGVVGQMLLGSVTVSGSVASAGVAVGVKGGIVTPVPTPLTMKTRQLSLTMY